jgi:hypothetical protein
MGLTAAFAAEKKPGQKFKAEAHGCVKTKELIFILFLWETARAVSLFLFLQTIP